MEYVKQAFNNLIHFKINTKSSVNMLCLLKEQNILEATKWARLTKVVQQISAYVILHFFGTRWLG